MCALVITHPIGASSVACTASSVPVDAISYFVGLVFVAAGASKIWQRVDYGAILRPLPLPVPVDDINRFAPAVAGSEIYLGLRILAGYGGSATVWAAIIMLGLFTALIVFLIRRDFEGSCNCFGSSSDHRVGVTAVVRNTVLLSMCAMMIQSQAATGCMTAHILKASLPSLATTTLLALTLSVVYGLAINIEGMLRAHFRAENA